MEILRRCPMLAVLSGLVSGAALYDRLGLWAFILVVPAVFTGVMFLSYEWDFPEQWQAFLFALTFTILCSLRMYSVISSPPPENVVFIAEEGTVTEVREWGRVYAVVIDTKSRGKFVTFLNFANFTMGTRIKFDGATRDFRPKFPDSDFDEARFWRARGVNGVMSIHNPEELPERFSMAAVRQKLSRKLAIYMPSLTASYLRAAWVGERDKNLNDRHRNWGTSHLLAVSGFHVAVVTFIAMFFFGKDVVILSIILWVYIFLTGAAPSAMRAGLMLQIFLCARIFGRKPETVNSVSVAGVVLLLWSPFLFWDIGWRLSMMAALVIAAMLQDSRSWFPISPAVSLVTFPQVAYTFGSVPFVGLLLNLFAPIYFSFALTIASLGAALRFMNFPFSQYFMLAVEGTFMLWEKIADFFASLMPLTVGWNFLTAWIGCGTLTFFICRYLDLAPLRIAAVMGVIGFSAFALFL